MAKKKVAIVMQNTQSDIKRFEVSYNTMKEYYQLIEDYEVCNPDYDIISVERAGSLKMKIIRTGVFETNSSSCHSLVMNFVSSEKELDEDVQSCIKGKNQIMVTLDGYYDSNPAYSLEDKLSYIFSDVLQDYEDLIIVTEDKALKQEAYEGLPVEAIITLFNSGFGQLLK